jgi:hypothetical protein
VHVTDIQERTRAMAIGRIALGASFVFAPGMALRAWPGHDEGRGPVDRLLARSVGVRDIALGVGTLLAVQHDAPVRGWLEASMLADAGDAAAIVLGFRHLPTMRAVAMLAASVGAVVAGRQLVSALS